MSEYKYKDLSAIERIKKARMDLQEAKPFFSYLLMHLTFTEVKDLMQNAPGGIGVDKNGNIIYDPKYVSGLTREQVVGVLCHETMHVVLEHMDRTKNRKENPLLSNIAHDIIVNNILSNDIEKNGGMEIPEGGITPKENEINIFGYTIKDIETKCSEEIYDELMKHLKDKYEKDKGKIDNACDNQNKKGFDIHIIENKNDGENKDNENSSVIKGIPKDKLNKEDKDWKKILVDACTYAKERGNIPAGMERLIDSLYDTTVDWRQLLYKYITSQIPVDYTYSRPSKRSYTLGYYFPNVERESIDVVVAVDTSGSISNDELKEFMSEVLSITNSFKNVELTLIDCDCSIHGVHTFKHATADEIINEIKLKGGGGTSHIPVFKWIDENKPMAKFLIAFTDGYTEFPNQKDVKTRTLWAVAGENQLSEKEFPFGEVIKLPIHN